MKSLIAVFIGAGLGALLRWWLGLTLNSYFPSIPPGTLAANLIGGYIIGVAVAFFATYSALAPEWRLFIITGFCGGLTTFSTFSSEIVALLQQGRALGRVRRGGATPGGLRVDDFCGYRNSRVGERMT